MTGFSRIGFMQSFASAAEQFSVLDSQTQGVIVPFREDGKHLRAALSAAYDPAVQSKLLRKAQHFTVNVFPHEMETLTRSGAIYEALAGTGVFCLSDGFYSDEFGLTLDGSGRMESMFA